MGVAGGVGGGDVARMGKGAMHRTENSGGKTGRKKTAWNIQF